jgi:hypothetical protein
MTDTVTITFDVGLDSPHGTWHFDNVPANQWTLRLDKNNHPYIRCGDTIIVGRSEEIDRLLKSVAPQQPTTITALDVL